MKKRKHSVKIILRRDKLITGSNKCPIAILAYIDGKQFRLATGEKIETRYWDEDKSLVVSKHPFSVEINRLLSEYVNKINDFIYKETNAGRLPNKESITSFFYGKAENSKVDFLTYFKQSITDYAKVLDANTIKLYWVTHNKLQAFRQSIELKDVDEKFIEDFNLFLINDENNTVNGAWNKHKHLKKVLSTATKHKLIEYNPYDNLKGKFSEEESHKDVLTLKELKTLANGKLLGNTDSKINEVRDMFEFACNTGLRFSDIMTLKIADIDENIITKKMAKTQKFIDVPLNLHANKIVEKYKRNKGSNDWVFPQISNQKYNKNLKRIATQLGIKKVITSHTARHTFATFLANNDNNAFVIKEALGHASLKNSLKYVQISMKKKIKALNEINY